MESQFWELKHLELTLWLKVRNWDEVTYRKEKKYVYILSKIWSLIQLVLRIRSMQVLQMKNWLIGNLWFFN